MLCCVWLHFLYIFNKCTGFWRIRFNLLKTTQFDDYQKPPTSFKPDRPPSDPTDTDHRPMLAHILKTNLEENGDIENGVTEVLQVLKVVLTHYFPKSCPPPDKDRYHRLHMYIVEYDQRTNLKLKCKYGYYRSNGGRGLGAGAKGRTTTEDLFCRDGEWPVIEPCVKNVFK